MHIDLTFLDLLRLASNGKVEKDGNTIRISRPVLSESAVDHNAKTGEVRFYLDDTDPAHLTAL
jgi:hypothetical protein